MTPAQVCDPAAIELSGLCLIEASAGTGKTFTITALAVRMIVERNLAVDELLVVTFTKAATAELKTRIYERLHQALVLLDEGVAADPLLAKLGAQWKDSPGHDIARRRIAAALADFDRASVFTIHGWCQRLLQDYSFARGDVTALELRADHSDWLEGFAQDYWSRKLYDLHPSLVAAIYANPQRCGPQALMQVASLALADPDLDLRGAPDWEEASATFLRCHEGIAQHKARVAEFWREDAQGIRDYFQAIWPKLNQSTHRAATYQKRIDAIFDWVGRAQDRAPSETLKGAVEALCDQGLRRKKSLKAKQTLDAHPALVALDPFAEMMQALDTAQQELGLAFIKDFAGALRDHVSQRSQSLSDCTFDELLVRVRELLRDPLVGPDVITQTRATYAAALIDEFQDTDPAQYEIVSSFWGAGYGALFLVGDPKQAIYRFRGADIHAYLRAREDARTSRFMLTHNYRSHEGVIGAVNALFSGVEAPFGLKDLAFEPVKVGRAVDCVQVCEIAQPALSFWQGEKSKGTAHPWEIEGLAQRVLTLLSRGRWTEQEADVRAGDMAVLCNSNLQARKIRARFEELKIPCVLRSGQNVWHSPQGQEMAILLRAIAHPGQRHRLKAALITQALGLGLNEVWDLREDDAAWERWAGRFFAWRKLWLERGVLAMWRNLRDQVGLGPRLAKESGGLRALTNWEHLGDLVYFLEREHRCGPSRLCALVDRARSNQATPAEIDELRACDERSSVQILTIHKSKGLEFPIVFCPYLWKAKAGAQPPAFVHHEGKERVLMLSGPNAEDALETYAHDAHGESRRLLYVALTRAKSHCEVFWVAEKSNKSALGTLLAQHEPQGEDPLAGMQALAASHAGWIQAGPLEVGEKLASPIAQSWPSDLEGTKPRAPQAWQRFFGPKVSSYTGLARGLRQGGGQGEPERPGQDESLAEPELGPMELAADLRFGALEPGAKSGILLHALFQAALEPEVTKEQRSLILEQAAVGLGVETPSMVEQIVEQVLDVLGLFLPVGTSSLALGDLDQHSRCVEIEFLFRCGAFGGSRTIGGGNPVAFALADFARILVECARDPKLVAYGQSLAQRGAARIQGFLNGFIDLVFEHEGRYFVLDYKSNLIDGQRSNFVSDELWGYAAEQDYILQTLIYGVAMLRRLQQFEEALDPLAKLGDGYLLFLRGVDQDGAGLLRVPFEPELMHSLSALMERGFEPGAKQGVTTA